MVDAGCSYGFRDFIAKRGVSSLSYVDGLYLDYERPTKAKVKCNDIVLADAINCCLELNYLMALKAII